MLFKRLAEHVSEHCTVRNDDQDPTMTRTPIMCHHAEKRQGAVILTGTCL